MKLAVIVTEFPKTTETFIQRDLMAWRGMGADLRIYHLAPWRSDQILHDFARPLADAARHIPLGGRAATAALARHPSVARRRAGTILRTQGALPKIGAKSLAILPAALRLGEEVRDWGADHIHAEFAGHPATAAWIAHAVSGVPYSISCRAHDIFRTQRLLAEKFADAAMVRCVSGFARDFLSERVPGRTQIEVIHSSIDTRAITPTPPPGGGPLRILCVGALEAKKGMSVLLDALAGLEGVDWRLDVVGGGPLRGALQSQSERCGIAEKVRLHGPLPFSKVEPLYHAASVCVAPSVIGPAGRAEGIPNVMIEALAHGRPAISTAISGIPELIRDGDTGWLVPPGDAAALREALRHVARDPGEAARRAMRGRALVEAEYDLATNARRQLDLFADASARTRTKGAA